MLSPSAQIARNNQCGNKVWGQSMGTKLLGLLLQGLGQVQASLSGIDAELRIPLAIALGAVPGALSRYYLTRWCIQWLGLGFPYGTFIINLSGALVMGFFATFTLERAIASTELRALVAIGFLGAYTTFSTYALDTTTLLHSGQWGKSLIYWSGSAILGVICLEIGSGLARKIG
jgi:fluoride exporter